MTTIGFPDHGNRLVASAFRRLTEGLYALEQPRHLPYDAAAHAHAHARTYTRAHIKVRQNMHLLIAKRAGHRQSMGGLCHVTWGFAVPAYVLYGLNIDLVCRQISSAKTEVTRAHGQTSLHAWAWHYLRKRHLVERQQNPTDKESCTRGQDSDQRHHVSKTTAPKRQGRGHRALLHQTKKTGPRASRRASSNQMRSLSTKCNPFQIARSNGNTHTSRRSGK